MFSDLKLLGSIEKFRKSANLVIFFLSERIFDNDVEELEDIIHVGNWLFWKFVEVNS